MSVKRVIATVGLTSVETAIVKATFGDDEPPKKKHIKTICDFVDTTSQTGYKNNLTLTELFSKRVNAITNDWKVVLKSLLAIHSLFRDEQCDIAFQREFSDGYGENRVFSLTNNFHRDSTHYEYSTFIRKYSKYLSVKCEVFRELSFNVERKLAKNNKDFFKRFDVDMLGKILPQIMRQLRCLIDIGSQSNMHILIKESLLLLIKDSLRIYSSIHIILWSLVSEFQQLSLSQQKWVHKYYTNYFTLNAKYQQWFEHKCKSSIISYQFLPKFDTLPQSLANKLETYICEQEQSQKKKKNRKKKKREKKKIKKKETEVTEVKETDFLFEGNNKNSNEWSEWGTFGDDNNSVNNVNNFDDVFWQNSTNNNTFGSFVNSMNGSDMSGGSNNNGSAMSGGKARVLKKSNISANTDPFFNLFT